MVVTRSGGRTKAAADFPAGCNPSSSCPLQDGEELSRAPDDTSRTTNEHQTRPAPINSPHQDGGPYVTILSDRVHTPSPDSADLDTTIQNGPPSSNSTVLPGDNNSHFGEDDCLPNSPDTSPETEEMAQPDNVLFISQRPPVDMAVYRSRRRRTLSESDANSGLFPNRRTPKLAFCRSKSPNRLSSEQRSLYCSPCLPQVNAAPVVSPTTKADMNSPCLRAPSSRPLRPPGPTPPRSTQPMRPRTPPPPYTSPSADSDDELIEIPPSSASLPSESEGISSDRDQPLETGQPVEVDIDDIRRRFEVLRKSALRPPPAHLPQPSPQSQRSLKTNWSDLVDAVTGDEPLPAIQLVLDTNGNDALNTGSTPTTIPLMDCKPTFRPETLIIGDSMVRGMKIDRTTSAVSCNSGATVRQLLDKARHNKLRCSDMPGNVKLDRVKVVILMVGTNDACSADLDLCLFTLDYERLLLSLSNIFSARIICCEIPPVFRSVRRDSRFDSRARVCDINARINTLAFKHQFAFCEAYQSFLWNSGLPDRTLFARDGVHLNPRGKWFLKRAFNVAAFRCMHSKRPTTLTAPPKQPRPITRPHSARGLLPTPVGPSRRSRMNRPLSTNVPPITVHPRPQLNTKFRNPNIRPLPYHRVPPPHPACKSDTIPAVMSPVTATKPNTVSVPPPLESSVLPSAVLNVPKTLSDDDVLVARIRALISEMIMPIVTKTDAAVEDPKTHTPWLRANVSYLPCPCQYQMYPPFMHHNTHAQHPTTLQHPHNQRYSACLPGNQYF
jgi:hypothetical protein